ncbi:hypothetical protein K1T71_001395 [Dendrolimus kikuchii]|uniref:Uncharacterized protein n=1 Tax=Dendrolimus kikuchii TaxID=765133 RepID=A0ACC1DHH6_9NEOP|nr:hypothetical protein K1T71_001395 [Dendrolimus kikuchii]
MEPCNDSKLKHGNIDYFYKDFESFGRYQLIQFFLICLPLFVISMMHVNYVFVAEEVKYRPVINRSTYSFHGKILHSCQPWKATIVGSIHNAGMIVSMSFTGWIADKIGRKPTIIICSVGGVIGLIKLFVKHYYVYIAVEFLESVIASGLYTVAVVLMIEVGGTSKRVMTGVIFSYAVYVGEIVFSLIALGFQYWKYMLLAVYSPMILFTFYFYILGESTRWQILRGKIDEAKATLILIAKLNKIHIDADTIKKLDDQELRAKLNIEKQTQKESFSVIIQSKEIMMRLFVTSFCFFTSSFLYYGLIVHSVYLPGNKYINFILSSLTSFPGEVIAFFMFDRVGRRLGLQFGYIASALFLIAQNFTPESILWLKVLLFCLGKMGVVVCFTGIYTYSLELFPTSVRGSLLGVGNTVARIGSMLAPLTPFMILDVPALPFILFSTTALISATLLFFTPETKTLPLFDTSVDTQCC